MKKNLLLAFVLLISSVACTDTSLVNKVQDKTAIQDQNKTTLIEIKDMVVLDQKYVPSLVSTSQNNLENSKKSVSLLKENWLTFKQKYYDKSDKDTKSNFDKIDTIISDTEKSLDNSKIADAHAQLEPFREIFYEIRKINKIDYYMDYVTDFHKEMENVLNAGILEGSVDIKFDKIKEVLTKTISVFNTLESAKFDAKEFNFSDEKEKQRNAFMLAEKNKLQDLKNAVDTNNKELAIKLSQEVKENFVKLFTLFGDFSFK